MFFAPKKLNGIAIIVEKMVASRPMAIVSIDLPVSKVGLIGFLHVAYREFRVRKNVVGYHSINFKSLVLLSLS